MKVSYYGYYVRQHGTNNAFRVDMTDFFEGFSKWKIRAIKSKLGYNGEPLFFLNFATPVYMFIQARDSELIKAIERKSESVQAIAAMLTADDSIGVASYVAIRQDHIAIACRLLSPRITAFASMVNQIFMKMQFDYAFEVRPLKESVTKQELYRFNHVGAVTIDLDASNGFFANIMNVLTANNPDLANDVGSLHITARPIRSRSRSIAPLALKMESVIPKPGLSSFEARARREVGDQMTDVYLVGQGQIRDECNVDESKVAARMLELVDSNSRLRAKLNEFRKDASLPAAPSSVRNSFDWQRARAAYLAKS